MKKRLIKIIVSSLLLVTVAAVFLYNYYLAIGYPAQPNLSGQLLHSQLSVDGHNRDFNYYLPNNLKAGAPLVFVLHGSMSDGAAMRSKTAYQFDKIADTEGFIVVYPNGYKKHWNDCRASARYAANTQNINDVKFISNMVDFFARSHQIDTSQVFATGFSNGGHLAYRLGFERPEQFAAIAPIAANHPVMDNFDCEKTQQAVSVAIFNGTRDQVNPYDGGLVSILGDNSRGAVISTKESVNYWRNLAGITQPATITELSTSDNPATHVTLSAWQGANGTQLRLYTLHNSGHVVPSRLVKYGKFFGSSATDIEAAQQVWDFFSETIRDK